MPKFKRLINSFSFGELGPEMSGRIDLKEYFQGAKELQNFLPNQQGSLSRRPSIDKIRSLGKPTLNNSSDELTLPDGFNVTAIEELGFTTITVVDVNVSIIYLKVTDSGIGSSYGVLLKVPHEDDVPTQYVVVHDYIENFSADVSFFKLGSGAVVVSETGELAPIFFSLDINFSFLPFSTVENIYHGVGNLFNQGPFSVSTFRTDYIFPLGIPFKSFSITGDKFRIVSRVTTNIFYAELDGYSSSLAGKYIRVRSGAVERLFRIIGSYSPSPPYGQFAVEAINPFNTTGDVERTFQTATDNWAISTWGGYDGFPTSVSYHQNRLILGGLKGTPGDVIWCSQIDDIYQFTEPRYYDEPASDPIETNYTGEAQPSDAFSVTLGADSLDSVKWISSGQNLLVGTDIAEYAVYSVDGTFTNATVGVKTQSSHGGADVTPITLDGASIFISGDGSTLREIRFSNESQAYVTQNLNKLHPEIIYKNRDELRISYIDMKFTGNKNVIWFLTSAGTIITATVDLSNRIIAWARIESELTFKGISIFKDSGVTKLSVLADDNGYLGIFSIDAFTIKRVNKVCDVKVQDTFVGSFDFPIEAQDGQVVGYDIDDLYTEVTVSTPNLIVPYVFEYDVTTSTDITFRRSYGNASTRTVWKVDFAAGASVSCYETGETLVVDASNEVTINTALKFVNFLYSVPSTDPLLKEFVIEISPENSTGLIEDVVYDVIAGANGFKSSPVRRGVVVSGTGGVITTGRPFESLVETMPQDIQSQLGNSLGDKSTNSIIDVLTERYTTFSVGSNGTDTEYDFVPEQNGSTGAHRVELPNAVERDATVKIRVKGFEPLDINGIKITGSTY